MACYHKWSCRAPLLLWSFINWLLSFLIPHPAPPPLSPSAPRLMCLIHRLGRVSVCILRSTPPRKGFPTCRAICFPWCHEGLGVRSGLRMPVPDPGYQRARAFSDSPSPLRRVSCCLLICLSLLPREIEHLVYLFIHRFEVSSAVRRKFNTQANHLPLLFFFFH